MSRKEKLNVQKVYGYLRPTRSENKKFLNVSDWLYGIASSKFVITDSFHAMVFAIQFRKPFYIYISEASKAARITNILGNLGINNRIVTPDMDFKSLDLSNPIDYTSVISRLKKLRERSIVYLNSVLHESSNL